MKPALIDTNILSFFFRDRNLVVEHFEAYLKEHHKINISIITYYEILSGLKHRDAQKQLTSFLEFVSHNTVLPRQDLNFLTKRSNFSREGNLIFTNHSPFIVSGSLELLGQFCSSV